MDAWLSLCGSTVERWSAEFEGFRLDLTRAWIRMAREDSTKTEKPPITHLKCAVQLHMQSVSMLKMAVNRAKQERKIPRSFIDECVEAKTKQCKKIKLRIRIFIL
ncbi:hypothetical protein pdam_00022945 [Pocillopora damicornis]|uniref:Uncharacterized protein n=1 Tax=Pocillopora damicornis TaxID=46731 RepID=A0A3M6UPD5_POCDA|nr:hypothetical protein pdam_00022945 [Pocillopora damicornis]